MVIVAGRSTRSLDTMHGRMGILIDLSSISGALSVEGARPISFSYSTEGEALEKFGEFIRDAPIYTSLEVGVLKRHNDDSEFLNALLDTGFNVTLLNPNAVAQFTAAQGAPAVSPHVLVELLASAGL
jgi:hypothetical protein